SWPVIERELRAESRHSFTYWLRVLGAGAVLAVAVVFLWGIWRTGTDFTRGPPLFGSLQCGLFISIWTLVPLMSSDYISREKREGTLGLLFLTLLRAPQIVLAKGLGQGLRALTLWLAIGPVLAISFLAGGVSWKEAVISGLVNFSSFCLALAAGLLA